MSRDENNRTRQMTGDTMVTQAIPRQIGLTFETLSQTNTFQETDSLHIHTEVRRGRHTTQLYPKQAPPARAQMQIPWKRLPAGERLVCHLQSRAYQRLAGSFSECASALEVFGSPPWPFRRPPREGQETKGKERKRPKTELCNPSRSFFVFGASVKNAFLPERCRKILKALSPESGAIFGAKGPQTRGRAHSGFPSDFFVRAVRGVISGMCPGTRAEGGGGK